jgi:hypothetical protein
MAGRRNWLPRCGALTRRGTYCLMKPVLNEDGRIRNGRCRLHAGCSTGPRTLEGKARCTAGRQRLYDERRAAGLPCVQRKPKPAPQPQLACYGLRRPQQRGELPPSVAFNKNGPIGCRLRTTDRKKMFRHTVADR